MKILLIVLDGCSVSILEKAETPFLDMIVNEGVSSLACSAVFPTATYTCHSSIITGCYPSKTGMIGNQYYDRAENMRKHFDHYDANAHIECKTIFEYLTILNPVSICEPVSKGAIEHISMSEINNLPLLKRNEEIFRRSLKQLDNNNNIRFLMINFSGVDSIGEIFGPNSIEYKKEIEKVDGFIEQLYTKISDHEDILLIITADHGLTEIESTYNISKVIEKLYPDVVCLPSHRSAHIYNRSNSGDLERIIGYLKRDEHVGRIIRNEDFYKFHLKHERSGDLIITAAEGIEFEVNGLKGSHGGLSEEELKVPLLILSSSNFKFELAEARIIDIMPSILDILKIKPVEKLDGKSLVLK